MSDATQNETQRQWRVDGTVHYRRVGPFGATVMPSSYGEKWRWYVALDYDCDADMSAEGWAATLAEAQRQADECMAAAIEAVMEVSVEHSDEQA